VLKITKLDIQYCKALAKIISTDALLHQALTPSQEMREVTAAEYYQTCREWESKKNGVNFCILSEGTPIGSISYVHENETTASYGMWLASAYWNNGYGTIALQLFKETLKSAGYAFLTGSIQKSNPRSKRICEKSGATFTEDNNRWYPLIGLCGKLKGGEFSCEILQELT